ncbi:MAG: cobalamin-binding protein [Gammaproteobacteria bacterium]|nr:cobalamin-binding protein [Gammaproteobacteria bacterium]
MITGMMLKNYFLFIFIVILMAGVSANASAQIVVVDATGQTLAIKSPAVKVISLAPHATELLYAAGASHQLVAAVDFSDYPPQAKKLPRIGSYSKFDLESIIALKPDLIVVWKSGNPGAQIAAVERLGFNMFYSEPRALEDVAVEIRKLGKLLGTQHRANETAANYLAELQQLRKQYSSNRKLTVFYQVWNEPLFTVNGEHIINQVIELCGGDNVFKDIEVLSPRVSIESVIAKNPDVVLVGMVETRKQWLDDWRQWQGMSAVKNNHLYPIDADLIVRHTPRILEGARIMCEYLQSLRK